MSRVEMDDAPLTATDLRAGRANPYAERFLRSAAWYEQAVQEDEAAWLAEALHEVQELELAIFTYWVLATDGDLAVARERARRSLESPHLPEMIDDLRASVQLADDLPRRLAEVATARSWLVHGSFLAEPDPARPRAARLRDLAEEARWLREELHGALTERFVGVELPREDFDRRTAAARRAWPAAA